MKHQLGKGKVLQEGITTPRKVLRRAASAGEEEKNPRIVGERDCYCVRNIECPKLHRWRDAFSLRYRGLGKVKFLDANINWGPFWYKEIELLIAGLCYEREQATGYHQLPAGPHWHNSDHWQIDLEIRTREEMEKR